MALFHSFYDWAIFYCVCVCPALQADSLPSESPDKPYMCIYTHTYCIFFINSSVYRHLICFHVLAIVNSAFMNTGVHVSFQSMVFSRYMPQSGWYDNYMFSFLRSLHTVFHNGCINLYPTNSAQEFSFLRTQSNMVSGGHSDWCEVTSHDSFDLHFSNN